MGIGWQKWPLKNEAAFWCWLTDANTWRRHPISGLLNYSQVNGIKSMMKHEHDLKSWAIEKIVDDSCGPMTADGRERTCQSNGRGDGSATAVGTARSETLWNGFSNRCHWISENVLQEHDMENYKRPIGRPKRVISTRINGDNSVLIKSIDKPVIKWKQMKSNEIKWMQVWSKSKKESQKGTEK